MNFERKTIIELSIAAVIIIAVALLGFMGYRYFTEKNLDVADNQEVEQVVPCEELNLITPANVSAPTVPVLESKLNVNAKANLDICKWSIDDKVSHTSLPVKGKCVFGDQVIEKAGVYKIGLDVKENNCSLIKTIILN